MRLLRSLGIATALIALLPSVLGQQLPPCAVSCLETSLRSENTCAATDIQCVCNTPAILDSTQDCVLQSCTIIEVLSAKNATETMCGHPVRNIGNTLRIIVYVSMSFAIAGMLARLITRAGNYGLDDLCAVIALAFAIIFWVTLIIEVDGGFGKDMWTLTPTQITLLSKHIWMSESSYVAAIAIIKCSFLYFCLRIFPRRGIRITLHTLLVISWMFGVTFTFTTLFNCIPITYIWEGWDGLHKGKCLNFNVFTWVHAAINIALDIAVLAVPIPDLLRLQLGTKQKALIIAMFGVGAVTTVLSILRLKTVVQYASKNPSYDNIPTVYWSVLEVNVGLFCICMPGIRRCVISSTRWLSPRDKYIEANSAPYGTPDWPPRSGEANSWGRGSSKSGNSADSRHDIVRTIDTYVESRNMQEDEVELVSVQGIYKT